MKRLVLRFALAGFIIAVCLFTVIWFHPDSLPDRVYLVLFPPSFLLMLGHDIHSVLAGIVVGIILASENALLYALLGFVAGLLVKIIKRAAG